PGDRREDHLELGAERRERVDRLGHGPGRRRVELTEEAVVGGVLEEVDPSIGADQRPDGGEEGADAVGRERPEGRERELEEEEPRRRALRLESLQEREGPDEDRFAAESVD